MKTLLRLCISVILVIVISVSSFGQWQAVNTPFNGASVWFFASYGTSILASTDDGIYQSSDNGISWSYFGLSGMGPYYIAVYGTDIYASTWGNGLLRSSDGGSTWNLLANGINSPFINGTVINGADLFVCADDGLYRSSDNGNTFTQMDLGVSTGVTDVYIDNSTILAATYNGAFKSDDYGATWSQIDAFGYMWVDQFINIGGILYVPTWGGYGLYYSTDGGMSWIPVTGFPESLSNIMYSYENFKFVCTNSGVYISKNGTDWFEFNDGLNAAYYLTGMYFTNDHIFTGGAYSGLWTRSMSDLQASALTNPASYITDHQANLNGSVNPAGNETTVSFEYGTTTSYGYEELAAQSPVNGFTQTPVTAIITNLQSGTLYHFRIKTINNPDTLFSADDTFTTNTTIFDITGITLPACGYGGFTKWADVNNDGRPDLLVAGGNQTGANAVTKLYFNNGNGSFTLSAQQFPGVVYGSAAFGDYNNDGYLDLILSGYDDSGHNILKMYRNNGNGTFTETNNFVGYRRSDVAWFDYNNDGYLDFIVCGYTNTSKTSVYKNNGDGTFTIQPDIQIHGLFDGSISIADYDKDGFADILICGYDYSSPATLVYKNDGNGNFIEQTSILLTGTYYGNAVWGDYNNDGYPDILINGITQPTYDYSDSYSISKVYLNNGNGSFTEQNINLIPAGGKDVNTKGVSAWVDYDNDGWLDIALAGNSYNSYYYESPSFNLYHNNHDNTFSLVYVPEIPPILSGSMSFADYDNDGKMDLVYTGVIASGTVSEIFHNEASAVNTVPSVPTGLSTVVNGANVTFNWNKATDTQTPVDGLTYNLRYGTTPGGIDRISPLSDENSGYRKVMQMGNAFQDTSITIKNYNNGTCYWSVQALDNNFAGSGFAPEQSLVLDSVPVTPPALFQFQPNIIIPGFIYSKLAWGEYNNDNNLDLLIEGSAGQNIADDYYTDIYTNNGDGTFTKDINAGLLGLEGGSVNWADFNNDGLLDILITGLSKNQGDKSLVYFNNGDGNFTLQAELSGVEDGGADVGDFNNDGYPDIVVNGASNNFYNRITKVYMNNKNGTFTEMTYANLPGTITGCVKWFDYDNDGYLDLIITGENNQYQNISSIYKGFGNGHFELQSIPLTTMYYNSIDCGDYNNDGYTDILMIGQTGYNTSVLAGKLYRNNGNGTFSDSGIDINGSYFGSGIFGDVNNDGWLDMLVTSEMPDNTHEIDIYLSNGDGTFNLQDQLNIPGIYNGCAAFGDFDNDGKLDFALTGITPSGLFTGIYKNTTPNENIVAGPPSISNVDITGQKATITWTPGTANTTPVSGLSYNVSIGESPTTVEGLSPMADLSTGYRRVVSTGNAGLLTGISVKDLKPGTTYYCNVQAIDHSFAGSLFSSAGTFTTTNAPIVQTKSATVMTTNSAMLQGMVNANGLLTTIYFEYGINTGYGNSTAAVPASMSDTILTPVSANISGLLSGTAYHFRLVAENSDGLVYGDDMEFNTHIFEESGINIQSTRYGSVEWGDVNNDGYPDLLITGATSSGINSLITRLYMNNGNGTFTQASFPAPGVRNSSTAFGDYNNDGWLDVLVMGTKFGMGSNTITKIYRNNGDGTFTDSNISLPGYSYGDVKWFDYNNDGNHDLIISGYSSGGYVTKIFKNNGDGTFTEQTGTNIIGLDYATIDVADYDRDGFTDVLISGLVGPPSYTYMTRIYKNNGDGSFTLQNTSSIDGTERGTSSWGDFNNDGYPDILVNGWDNDNGESVTLIYQNMGDGTFSLLEGTNFTGCADYNWKGTSTWVDFDNDGWLDVAVTGDNDTPPDWNDYPTFALYCNNHDNTFSLVSTPEIQPAYDGVMSFADYDNDGKMDFVLQAYDFDNNPQYTAHLYRNMTHIANTAPVTPDGLTALNVGTDIIFSWNKASDAETPQNGLGYNLRVADFPGGADRLSPMSDVNDGHRQVVHIGNASQDTSITLHGFTNGSYYWSVQSLDNNYVGSAFAPEQSLNILHCSVLNYLPEKCVTYIGNYSDLGSNGSQILTDNTDDANSNPVDIGFSFSFDCQDFTQFVLNTNGFIKLGNTNPSSAALFPPAADNGGTLFASANPADANLIIPFNYDLIGNANTEYRVYTSGTAPNRICTIQYKNLTEKTTIPSVQYDNIEFQIRLYETTNVIEFVYGTWTPSLNASAYKGAGCGLKGSDYTVNQVLAVRKNSGTAWGSITFQAGNYPAGSYGFNFGNPPARPAPEVGRTFRFSPLSPTDATVVQLYAMGKLPIPTGVPNDITGIIKNSGTDNLLNYPVYLNITGANTYSDTAYIDHLAPNESTNISFAGFFPAYLGWNTVSISVPDDGFNYDNSKHYGQWVNEDTYSYADTTPPGNYNWGFGTGAGIFLVRYNVNGIKRVSQVRARISNYDFNVGHTVYGVVVSPDGTIIGQSDNYVITAADKGQYVTFTINNPPLVSYGDFYAGMAQTSNGSSYYPLVVQPEAPGRPNAYYGTGLSGGTISMVQPSSGVRYVIEASVTEPAEPVAIPDQLLYCAGDSISVSFTTLMTFNPGNEFTLELSDQYGDFSSPVILGTSSESPVKELIPGNIPYGTGYRVRINASDPSTTGIDNGEDIIINNPVYTESLDIQVPFESLLTSNSPVCGNYDLLLQSPFIADAHYSWTGPDGFISTDQNPVIHNATLVTAGDYTLVVIKNGCYSEPFNIDVEVIPVIVPQITVNGGTVICLGDSAGLSAVTIPGFNYQWQLNGQNIEGATGATYKAYMTGSYTITLIASCGNFISDAVQITVTDPLNGLGFVNQQGLIAYYPNNGNANDASGNGFNGTVNGCSLTTDKDGIQNHAYYYNYGNYINYGTMPGISFGEELTVCAWVNPSNFYEYGGIVTKGSGGYEDFTLVTQDDQRFHFRSNWPNNWYDMPSAPHSTGQWYFLTGVFDHGTASIYVNGVLENSGTWGMSSLSNPSDSWLSTGVNQPGSWEYFTGTIDEVRLYNRVLTNEEIGLLYSSAPNIVAGVNPVCLGGTLQLSAQTIQGASYSWSGPEGFSSNEQNPVITGMTDNQAGDYNLVVTNNGCSTQPMSVHVQVIEPPVVDLGPDLTICQNSDYTLDAGNAGSTFVWNNGSTNQTLTVSDPGTYSVTVTSTYGCVSSDEVVVNNLSPVLINLPDTIIAGCGTDSYMLDAGADFTSYYWNTGEYSQIKYVYGTGIYTVTVTDPDGCIASKTVFVSLLPPIAQSSQTICYGSSTIMSMSDTSFSVASDYSVKATPYWYPGWEQPGFDDSYWNNAIYAGCTGVVPGSNRIWCNPYGGNAYFRKSFNLMAMPESAPILITADDGFDLYVNGSFVGSGGSWGYFYPFDILPYLHTGENLIAADAGNSYSCYQLTFRADFNHVGIYSYLWSTAETSQAINVSPLVNTSYYVTVSDGIQSCTDSVTVNINPLPQLSLQDTILVACETASFQLDAGGGYDYYAWNNGGTAETLDVQGSGRYSVTVTDENGCNGSDTTFVSYINSSILQDDIWLCSGSSVLINNTGFSAYLNQNQAGVYQYDSFEGGPGSPDDWFSRDGVDPDITNSTSYTGNYSLHMSSPWGGDFENGSYLEPGQAYGFYTNDYPYMSMAYKIPEGTIVNMLVYIQNFGNWHSITMNQGESPCSYPKIASWNEGGALITDNQWHFKTINLRDQMNDILGTGNYYVTAIIWYDGGCETPVTGEFWIDDFMITREAPINPNSVYSLSWSTGATTSSIMVSPIEDSTYYLTVTDGIQSCTDSVTVHINPLPIFSLPDTVYVPCGTSSYDLNASEGFVGYLWSNNATDDSINIFTSGTYACTVTDQNGCISSSQSTISIIPPLMTHEQTICQGNNAMIFSNIVDDNNLVAYYPFNGNAIDESGNGHDGSVYGAQLISDRFGQSNSAYYFNGSSYIETANSNGMNFSGAFTASVWINVNYYTGENIVIIGKHYCGYKNGWFITHNGSGFAFYIGGSNQLHTTQSYIDGNWHHVVAVFDGYYQYLYVDGALDNYQPTSPEWGNSAPVRFGVANCSYYRGGIDDIAIFSRALSAQEISEFYSTNNLSAVNYNYSWSTGEQNSNINVSPSETTTYYVTITDGMQSCTDSFTVNINPIPELSLQDTILVPCGTSSYQLDAGDNLASYLWSTGEQSSSIPVGISGTYSVTVSNGFGCTRTDSSMVSIIPPFIQEDTAICTGSDVLLGLDVQQFTSPGVNSFNFTWSTAETSADITVSPTETSTYFVTITDGIQTCTDSITVNINPLPQLSLQDTILVPCGTTLFQLDAGGGYSYYSWNNGGTAEMLDVQGSGKFSVTVTDENGCKGSDTTMISYINSPILQNDLWMCPGSSVQLSSTGYLPYTDLNQAGAYDYDNFEGGPGSPDDWTSRNGVDPDITNTTSYTGNYSLHMPSPWGRDFESGSGLEQGQPYGFNTDDYPYMSMAYKVPPGTLVNMLVLIPGYSWCSITMTQGETPCTYPKVASWNEGGDLIADNQWHFKTINLRDQMNAILGTGNYYITAVIWHTGGCLPGPAGEFWIDDFMITHDVPADPRSVYSFSWSTGDTTTSVNVTPVETTTYYLTVSDGMQSCTDSATVHVNPQIVSSLPDTLIVPCGDHSAILDAGTGNYSYLWNTGEITEAINAYSTGTYSVTLSDENGCQGTHETYVSIIPGILQSDTAICYGSGIEIGIIPDNTSAYYPFNGNANDQSGNGNDGTVYGASLTNDRFNNQNSAYSFSGNGDYILVADPVPADLQIQNEITLSAWIFVTDIPYGDLGLIAGSQYDGTGSGASIFFDGRTSPDGQPSPPGHIHFQIGNGSWHTTNSNSTVPLNQWVLITATRKANENGKIYYNGVLQPSNSAPWNGEITYYGSWLAIGRQKDLYRPFNGMIDEVRIYNRALSQQEILSLYNYDGIYSYNWSTGETSASVMQSPHENTTYYVTVTDGTQTCSDSVTVHVNTIPEINLGVNLTNCNNSPMTLDAGNPGANFLWNDGSTGQTLGITGSGTYSVTVSNNNCSASGEVSVIYYPPLSVDLGNDTTLYTGNSIILDAGPGGEDYLWSTGETTQSIVASTTGTYSVTVTNPCGSESDEINVTVINPPLIEVHPSSITAILNYGEPGSQTFTIINSGNDNLSFDITDIPWWFGLSQTNGIIAPGNFEEITVSFANTLPGSDYYDLLNIYSNDPANPLINLPVYLTVYQPLMYVTPTDINFGTVVKNFTSSINVSLVNNGNADITVNSITTMAPFSVGSFDAVVHAGTTMNVAVNFTPTATVIYHKTLSISTSFGNFSVDLHGTGQNPAPGWSFSFTDHNFGYTDTATGATTLLTINNTGNVPVNITNVVSSSPHFTISETAFTIPVGSNHNVQIGFNPNALISYSGVLNFSSNNCGTKLVTLEGIGMMLTPPPQLTYDDSIPFNGSDGVAPTVGPTSQHFEYSVIYTDPDNNPPMAGYPKIGIDVNGDGDFLDSGEGWITMSETDASDHNYIDGKKYVYYTTFPASPYYAYSYKAYNQFGDAAIGEATQYRSGPLVSNNMLDLLIYANDITFSDPTPAIGQEITIYANVHDYSDYPADTPFVVQFWAEDTLIGEQTVNYLGAHSSIILQMNHTFTWPEFYPIKVIVDATNVLTEDNEFNNFAIRPIIAGEFSVPGSISVTANISPEVSYYHVGEPPPLMHYHGHADYVGSFDSETQVSGAEVTLTYIEAGLTLTTFTNSNGDFDFYFYTDTPPEGDTAIYHAQSTVTDYTLTSTTGLAHWKVITSPPAPKHPDLNVFHWVYSCCWEPAISWTDSCILAGEPIEVTASVWNSGDSVAYNVKFYGYKDNVTDTAFVVYYDTLYPGEGRTEQFTVTFDSAGNHSVGVFADPENTIAESNEGNNQTSISRKIYNTDVDLSPGIPGLNNGIWISKVDPLEGENVMLSLSTTNSLCNIAGASTGRLYDVFNGDSTLIEELQYPLIGPMDNVTRYIYNYSFDSVGDHTLVGIVDYYNQVIENDETNNTGTLVVHVKPRIPDLTFSTFPGNVDESLNISASDVNVGDEINFSAGIQNYGTGDAENFFVRFYLDNVPLGSPVLIPLLQAHQSVTLISDPWTILPCGHKLRVTIDEENLVSELNEDNNEAKKDNLGVDLKPVDPGGSGWANTPIFVGTTVYNLGAFQADSVTVYYYCSNCDPLDSNLLLGYDVLPHVPAQGYTWSRIVHTFTESKIYNIHVYVDSTLYCEIKTSNNSEDGHVGIMHELPDLVIYSYQISPTELNPDPGEDVSIYSSFNNTSNVASGPFKVQFKVDSNPIGDIIDVPNLGPHGDTTVACSQNWSSLLIGPHIIRVFLDTENQVNESSELNNEASRAIIVGDAPDMKFANVDGLVLSNDTPAIGDWITITVRIKDIGGADGAATVNFYYVNASDSILIQTNQFTLHNHDSMDITFPWQAASTFGKITGVISGCTPTEFNLYNNTIDKFFGTPLIAMTAQVVGSSLNICGSGSTQILAIPAGGTGSYTVTWTSDPPGLNYTGTSLTVSPTFTTTYIATITDGYYTQTYSTVVAVNSIMTVAFGGLSDLYCANGQPSLLIPNPSGGVFNGPGINGYYFDPSIAGPGYHAITYNYSDPNGCNGTVINHTTVVAVPEFTLDHANATCNGSSDGSVMLQLTNSGETTEILWSNGMSDQNMNGLVAGIYTVTVTFDDLCSSTGSAEIMQPEPLAISSTVTGISATGMNDGSIDLTVSGGTSPYSFYWSDGSLTGDIENLQAGTYSVTVTDAINCQAFAVYTVYVITSQTIQMVTGWNLYSTYIDPVDPGINAVLSPVISQVIIAKNDDGLVFWPLYGVDYIGNVKTGKAYYIKMSTNQALTITGALIIPELTPLNLRQNWSYTGYLRETPASIAALLSNIISHVVIVTDGGGNVFWPSWGLNHIGNMNPGLGYHFMMSSPDILIYPPDNTNIAKSYIDVPTNKYYTGTINTGNYMILGIPGSAWQTGDGTIRLNQGDEIGVFDESGNLIGSSVYNSENTAITLWGDDITTQEKDGMADGEKFTIRVWQQATPGNYSETETELKVAEWKQGNDQFSTDQVAIVEKFASSEITSPVSCLYQNIPNPFRDETHITFYLPENCDMELSVYNVLGEKITTLVSGNLPAGDHTYYMNGKDLPSGTYFYRLITPKASITKAMNIVK
ncbi:MAG: FG-GAP-like repeat-containing protein [Bacteroidia bacterium]|nr:FG-GAP-like repeat-containing protein [Bacteroidia bacterium]